MKKLLIIFPILLVALICLFCYKQNDTIVRLGINTEIVEINNDDKTITVHYKDEYKSIDLNFKVDCNIAIEKHQIFYCDYSTHMIQELSFDSLFVGDEIILSISIVSTSFCLSFTSFTRGSQNGKKQPFGLLLLCLSSSLCIQIFLESDKSVSILLSLNDKLLSTS